MSLEMADPSAPDVAWPRAGRAGPTALWSFLSCEIW